VIRINLLPVRVSRKKIAGKNQLIFFGLALILALIGNFFWSASREGEMARREAQLKRTRDDIVQLERIIGEVKDIKAEQAALKEKLAILDKLKAARSGPVRMLDELATITPKKLELKKLEEKSGAVTFEGSAASIDDVSAFMSALRGSRYFSNVELKKTAAGTRKAFRVVDFTINATANYAPGVAQAPPAPGASPAPAAPPARPAAPPKPR
jgi:type IV pilus assembly protein PilN